ncbi:MAG: hypothetical protein ACT4OO_03215 [Nitrospiraceae bacterium]
MSSQSAEAIPLSINNYASLLLKTGMRLVPGASGTYWVKYESFAMMRVPTFCLVPPSSEEVESVLWRGRSVAAAYLLPPDDSHLANAWLYVCTNKCYRLEGLNVTGRRDARRANRSLRMCFIDWPTVLAEGYVAYRDTRLRVGLSDGTLGHFRKRLARFSSNPSHCAIGAWKDEVLVAFMTLAVVDDWVEIEGCFSADHHRTLCPNDGLASFVLRHYLAKGNMKTVSYGLSSIQETDQTGGLHLYKQKVGFEANPVHRAFTLHPLIRPFANQFALQGVNLVRGLFPRNRLVKKASGMLSFLLGRERISETSLENHND